MRTNCLLKKMAIVCVCILAAFVLPLTVCADPLDHWNIRNPAVNGSYYGVTNANGLFVATGGYGTNAVLTSPDGVNWQAHDFGGWGVVLGVTYGNNRFVAVGYPNLVLTSLDGIHWTSQIVGDEGNMWWHNVAYGNNTFVMIGMLGRVYTSPDGYTWTPRDTGTYQELYGITYANNTFVAVGVWGPIVLTSPDGITWSSHYSGVGGLADIVYGNSTFVAVGIGGVIITSADGQTWTQRSSGTPYSIAGITFGDNIFVAVGDQGTIITSPNGIDWTPRSSGISNILHDVAYGAGTFVSVGENNAIIQSDVMPGQINSPPAVSAGDNIYMSSKDQGITTITGTATDADGDTLTYKWLDGTTIFSSGQVGSDGKVILNLGLLPQLSLGAHPLTLQVSDGATTSQSSMVLTVGNSAPTAAPSGETTAQVNTPVILGGQVADYDGDTLSYSWLEGGNILTGGPIATPIGGAPVNLPPYAISSLAVGTHSLVLQVSDGVNAPVTKSIIVVIIDTVAPTLAPAADKTILWPPNGKMVPVTIVANAIDNSGGVVQLKATVACNESEPGISYWTTPTINQLAGTITLSLKADRSGNGDGRQYTVTITATDVSGNGSAANVKIVVPHDQGKK